jgi:carboxymethylenebutenolidase
VLTPNLLYRGGRAPQFDLSGIGDPERRGEVIGRIMPFVAGLTAGKLVSDAESYLDFLDGLDGIAPGPVVIVGYCMGGRNALLTIEAYPERVKAIASFHGARLASDQSDSPHHNVGTITGELYLAFADNDHSMPAEQIEKLTAALDAAGVRYTSEVYKGAEHGFAMADTAAYSEEAEKRHWVNLFGLLDRTR